MTNRHEASEAMSPSTSSSSQIDRPADERREAARRYAEQLRAFSVHASLYAAGMLIMFAVNLFTNLSSGLAGDWSAWWSAWAFLGWSIGLVIHGLVVWLNRPTFTAANWEQRQIERLLRG